VVTACVLTRLWTTHSRIITNSSTVVGYLTNHLQWWHGIHPRPSPPCMQHNDNRLLETWQSASDSNHIIHKRPRCQHTQSCFPTQKTTLATFMVIPFIIPWRSSAVGEQLSTLPVHETCMRTFWDTSMHRLVLLGRIFCQRHNISIWLEQWRWPMDSANPLGLLAILLAIPAILATVNWQHLHFIVCDKISRADMEIMLLDKAQLTWTITKTQCAGTLEELLILLEDELTADLLELIGTVAQWQKLMSTRAAMLMPFCLVENTWGKDLVSHQAFKVAWVVIVGKDLRKKTKFLVQFLVTACTCHADTMSPQGNPEGCSQ